MRKACVLAAVWLAIGALPLAAQAPVDRASLVPGARIRVVYPATGVSNTRYLRGTFGSLSADTLTIRTDTATLRTILLGPGMRLETVAGQRPNALGGAFAGLVGGAAIGGVIGAASYKRCTQNCFADYGAAFSAAAGAVVGALGGAVIGAIVGSNSRTDHWVRVER